jgi:hypothetical protein
MGRGFLGTTYPKPAVLFQLLFNLSHGHGLLPLAPVLLGALPGLILMWERNYRREALLCAAVPAYYLLFNSAYLDWTGGYSYGPRYLSAGLMFLAPPLAMMRAAGNRRTSVLLTTLAIIGSALALIAESTNPLPHTEWSYPLAHLARSFLSGRLLTDLQLSGATNAGLFLGLHGIRSLAPLAIFWVVVMLSSTYFRKYR